MGDPTETLDSRIQSLLLDAAEWRLIGLLFEYPSSEWFERVEALSGEIVDQRLREACKAAPNEASEGMHHSIFGPGGPVPPREVSYLDGIQYGYLLSELSAHYQAFAFEPQTQEAEDHISVEAGFAAYLLLKEAYALSAEDAEHASITREARERFLDEHLSAMAQPIAAAISAVAPSYLVLASQVLAERAGPPRGPGGPFPADLIAGLDDANLTCGDSPAPEDPPQV